MHKDKVLAFAEPFLPENLFNCSSSAVPHLHHPLLFLCFCVSCDKTCGAETSSVLMHHVCMYSPDSFCLTVVQLFISSSCSNLPLCALWKTSHSEDCSPQKAFCSSAKKCDSLSEREHHFETEECCTLVLRLRRVAVSV